MGRVAKFEHNEAVKEVMFMIWELGYQQVSVKAISEKLGITRSSFYHAFGSREALFKKVFAYYNEYTPLIHLQKIEPNDAVLPTIERTFKELCTMRAKDTMRKGCLAMNSLAQFTHDHNHKNDLLCYVSEQLLLNNSYVEQLLQRAIQQHELPAGTDAIALALCLSNLFVGINIMSKAVHSEEDLWLCASTTLKGLQIIKAS